MTCAAVPVNNHVQAVVQDEAPGRRQAHARVHGRGAAGPAGLLGHQPGGAPDAHRDGGRGGMRKFATANGPGAPPSWIGDRARCPTGEYSLPTRISAAKQTNVAWFRRDFGAEPNSAPEKLHAAGCQSRFTFRRRICTPYRQNNILLTFIHIYPAVKWQPGARHLFTTTKTTPF